MLSTLSNTPSDETGVPDAIPSTRERLLAAAMRLFGEKGYMSTSVADVLAEANVNSGSLYHFFPGKQDLLLAVLEMYRTGIGRMLLAPAWEDVEDPIEKVFALLGRYRQNIVETDASYGCPIGSLSLELHEPDPVVRKALADNFNAWIDAVEGCLVTAGSRLPSEINRRELAEFVFTTTQGGVMLARTHRDVRHFDGAVRQLRGYFAYLESAAATPKRETVGKPRAK